MAKDDAHYSEMQTSRCGRRGNRCQRMIVMAFVLGAVSAIAGMLSSRIDSGLSAKTRTRSAPPLAD